MCRSLRSSPPSCQQIQRHSFAEYCDSNRSTHFSLNSMYLVPPRLTSSASATFSAIWTFWTFTSTSWRSRSTCELPVKLQLASSWLFPVHAKGSDAEAEIIWALKTKLLKYNKTFPLPVVGKGDCLKVQLDVQNADDACDIRMHAELCRRNLNEWNIAQIKCSSRSVYIECMSFSSGIVRVKNAVVENIWANWQQTNSSVREVLEKKILSNVPMKSTTKARCGIVQKESS